jgi:hypothetical protein
MKIWIITIVILTCSYLNLGYIRTNLYASNNRKFITSLNLDLFGLGPTEIVVCIVAAAVLFG